MRSRIRSAFKQPTVEPSDQLGASVETARYLEEETKMPQSSDHINPNKGVMSVAIEEEQYWKFTMTDLTGMQGSLSVGFFRPPGKPDFIMEIAVGDRVIKRMKAHELVEWIGRMDQLHAQISALAVVKSDCPSPDPTKNEAYTSSDRPEGLPT